MAIAGASPIDDSIQQLRQLWLCQHQGHLHGIITDAVGRIHGPLRTADLARHHRQVVQKSLLHPGLQQALGMAADPHAELVFADVVTADLRALTVRIDGLAIEADELTYRGLDFAFARDVVAYPFAVVRETGGTRWPELTRNPGSVQHL